MSTHTNNNSTLIERLFKVGAHFGFKNNEDQTQNLIEHFTSLDGRQDPTFTFNGKWIELTFTGYGKNDSHAGGTVKILKQYINTKSK